MSDSKRLRPTMLDVAKLSGVSYQTVSRVINNHPYVSDDTRKRVQVAIDELGYRPSKAAINLRAKSSKTIAIILYGGWFYGPVQIALNVEQAARASGFDVIINNITETHKQLSEALKNVKDWMVDGIILILPAQGLPQKEIKSICGEIPLIQIDGGHSEHLPTVNLSDKSGIEQLMEHLINLGHQQFCEISGSLNWQSAKIRHQTMIDICQKHEIPKPIHIISNWTTPGGYQATRRIIQQGHRFTALITGNDSMALGAYRALHQAGLSVPEDVSVVGFDDIPEAAYYTPALTTIRQNYIEIGSLSFDHLMSYMDDLETDLEQKIVIPKLIVRDSTAPIW